MARDNSFYEYIMHDILNDAFGITAKPMFSGWGLYKNGVIFGIIIESELYFKVGEQNRSEFEQMNSHPFEYTKKDGKKISMSYWLVPEEVLENKEKLNNLIEISASINEKKK